MLTNRIVCLLGLSFLFSTYGINTETPLKAMAVANTNNTDIIQVNNLGLIKHPIEIQFEKDRLELEKRKIEEQKRQAELRRIEELKRAEEEKKKSEPQWQEFILTYYGLLESECGKIDGITASGKKISRGMVASPPQLKFGTKIIIEGNQYVVEDRGSSKYIKVNNDGSIRLDVYVPRVSGESDRDYSKRIQTKGVKRVKGYIVK